MTTTIISGTVTGPVTFGSYSVITVTDTGRVTAPGIGVEASGTLISDGLISASGIGVIVYAGQSATNQSDGKMLGGDAAGGMGVSLASGGSFSNDGLVKANTGVSLGVSGTVSNQAAGTIEGGVAGISGGGTITNAGTISGGGGAGIAVQFASAAGNLLVVDPGAVFTGSVAGGGAGNTLEFASGATQGTFTGLGSHYVNFGQLSIGAGATWAATGLNTVAAGETFTDDGGFLSSGSFTNAGTMVAANNVITQDGGTFANHGSLAAGEGDAISVFSGGLVTNTNGGTVSGGSNIGARVGNGGTLVNAGLISGGENGGAYADLGGVVTNLAGGTMTGSAYGFLASHGGTLVNAGLITGGPHGGACGDFNAVVTNVAGGTIMGSSYGVANLHGTLINAGTIEGGNAASFAVYDFPSGYDRVVADPGAVFVGTVWGGGAGNTLEFASGASGGTFAGLGSKYVSFGHVSVDASATWTMSGGNTLAAGEALDSAGYLNTTGQFTNAGVVDVTNLAGLEVSGGTFDNNASVTVSGGVGILAQDHGRVTNAAGASITGGSGESVLVGAGATLVNAGTIVAGSASGDAVRFLGAADARLVVDPGAAFVGTVDGFNTVASTAASVLEFASGASSGTFSGLGSHYTNFAHIVVDTGAQWVARGANTISTGATLVNAGMISGGTYGAVYVDALGAVTNLAGGTITGTQDGLSGTGLTLVNAGTIMAGSASGDAVRFLGGADARLVVDPGAAFVGTVDGFNTIGSTAASVLEFASGASGGTFSGLGSQYVNFAHILVDTDAQWAANGVNTIASGAKLVDGGALTFAAAPVGGGSLQMVGFGVTLGVDGGASIGPSIGGLAYNTLELVGTVEGFAGLNGNSLTLDRGTTLTLAGSYIAGEIRVTNDGANTFVTACFADGTRIATASGEVAVEALRVGARVATASGRLARVAWIGHRRVDLRRHARPDEVMPVRVLAGALGDGVPARDLVLSPDHAVFVEGRLVPVRYLVNGRSIVAERRDSVTYWHVELDRHDLVLAEGLACESYLDTGNRGAFENGGEAVALHPEFGREHALRVWASEACAPILFDPAAPALRALHTGLLARAERMARAA